MNDFENSPAGELAAMTKEYQNKCMMLEIANGNMQARLDLYERKCHSCGKVPDARCKCGRLVCSECEGPDYLLCDG